MATILHQILSESASKWPTKIAIQEKNHSISYHALNQRSIQLANLIIQTGTINGSRVGLLTHKSIASYIGIYGILYSGCAYVPLDKRAPSERLNYICDDCQIETLIITKQTWSKTEQMLNSNSSIKHIIIIGDYQPEALPLPVKIYNDANIDDKPLTLFQHSNIVDSDLAYILYTSGSTGQPKGVMISHHVSMSFVQWAHKYASLTPEDKVSGHAPLHFDLSIFDIYATALAGATLYPVPDGASTFPSRLLEWIQQQEITVWYSVPSILSMMSQNANFSNTTFQHLRLLIFAGEVFPVPYLKKWLKAFPELTYMNWFGPTETNVITSYTVNFKAGDLEKPLPIGKPTENAHLFCLDDRGNKITKAGQSGELYARGPCVALGYWGDESKTRERFLENSLAPYLGDRIFKTGDIVSIDDNGDYTFLGRNDHLIKSRGYRIELGEVEAAFYQHKKIREAAVIPIPDDLIGHRLIAFISTDYSGSSLFDETKESSTEIAEISKSISAILPGYMVPSEIRLLNQLPQTSNGKIDRQRLLKQI